jgi:heat shock protein HtpX
VLDVMSAVLSVPFFAPQSLQLAAIALPTLSWLAVHWVWRRVGSGETLLHLGARAPAPGDLEERQLGNLVAEMAVAAGIPKPKVWLIDGEPPNAAAVGSSTDDAHVVVSRPVIDRLDRAATQAIVGHLVAQVADGDLRLGSTIQAVFYVLELMIVVTLAPFARMPRAIAAQWTAFFLAAPALGGDARKARARELVHALEQHRERFRQGSGMSERQLFRERDYLGRVGSVLVRTCPPLIALLLLGRALSDLLSLFVGIPIALLWRSRRYLADATSVELTRNPRALVAALETLASSDRPLPGSLREAHLFVLGSNRDPEEGTFAARHSIVIGMHPPIARRLARARAMVGA